MGVSEGTPDVPQVCLETRAEAGQTSFKVKAQCLQPTFGSPAQYLKFTLRAHATLREKGRGGVAAKVSLTCTDDGLGGGDSASDSVSETP